MPLLRERIYAKCSFARQFVISWISVLDMVPGIDLVVYLPELIDGLFRILDDPMPEVKKMCETTLGEFLRSIQSDPSRVDFAAMINILINHAQEKHDDLVQVFTVTVDVVCYYKIGCSLQQSLGLKNLYRDQVLQCYHICLGFLQLFCLVFPMIRTLAEVSLFSFIIQCRNFIELLLVF